METGFQTISPDADLAAVEKALRAHPEADLYVVDSEQKLLGVITLAGVWDTLKAGQPNRGRFGHPTRAYPDRRYRPQPRL